MLPAIAEVVLVGEGVAIPWSDATQRRSPLVAEWQVILWAGFSVSHSLRLEQVKMTVLPAHGVLADAMERRKRQVARDLDPAPDWRSHAFEGDLELVNRACLSHF